MQSLLIVSKNITDRLTHANELASEQGIDEFDITILERAEIPSKTDELKRKASIGIEDIQQLQKKIYLKPLRGETKAILIQDAHLLTTEAQNALLKLLEEPPPHTIIMLLAERRDDLLPTILSRCRIIQLTEIAPSILPDDRKLLESLLDSRSELTTADILKYAEILGKNKESSLTALEKLIRIEREGILKQITTDGMPVTKQEIAFLTKLQETHTIIKTTNANPRLILEACLLSLPR